jgi:hypothetical protein
MTDSSLVGCVLAIFALGLGLPAVEDNESSDESNDLISRTLPYSRLSLCLLPLNGLESRSDWRSRS